MDTVDIGDAIFIRRTRDDDDDDDDDDVYLQKEFLLWITGHVESKVGQKGKVEIIKRKLVSR
jgi:hypothetical protein